MAEMTNCTFVNNRLHIKTDVESMREAAAQVCKEVCLDVGAMPGSAIHSALVEACGRIKLLPIDREGPDAE